MGFDTSLYRVRADRAFGWFYRLRLDDGPGAAFRVPARFVT
jgi:hypothetical protein